MKNLDHIINKFDVTFEGQEWRYKNEGKKLVGCVAAYNPEELVYAAGMIPLNLWGFGEPLQKAKQYFPAFYSSVVQSIMEYGLEGKLDGLEALMVPGATDSLKSLGQNAKRAFKNLVTINVAYAQNRKLECGLEFNEFQYNKAKAKLEKIVGKAIEDAQIEEAIKVYNENRNALQKFAELAAAYPDVITPSNRSKVITSSGLMDKKEHTALLNELNAELEKLPVEKFKGTKIVTSGIIGSYPGLLEIFESLNVAIVADNVLEESGMFRYLVEENTGNPVRALAKLLTDAEGTSILFDVDKKRTQIVIDEVKKHKADGVILMLLKFCDSEEFDFPLMKKAFDKEGIRVLEVEADQQMTNYEQARTLIQTFVETL